MANIRQEVKVVVEFEDDQIESFAKLIKIVYDINNPKSIGFKLKKKIDFPEGVDDLIEELAYTLGVKEEEVNEDLT